MENNNINKSSKYSFNLQYLLSNFLNNINTLDKFNIIHYNGQIIPRISFNLNNFPSFYDSKKENIVFELKGNDINKTPINYNIYSAKTEANNNGIKKEENKKLFFKCDKNCITKNSLNNLYFNKEDIKNSISIKENQIEINNKPEKYEQNQMFIENKLINKNLNSYVNINDINILKESSEIKENKNDNNLNSNIISANIEKENDFILTNNNNSIRQPKTDKIIFVIDEYLKTNESNEKHMNFFVSKKRGRKNKSNKKIHSAFDDDNILRKIQVHYISFITSFINDIIYNFTKSETVPLFKKIDYKLKKDVSQDFFKKLKTLKISDIIQMRPSPKMKIHHESVNQDIYNQICNILPFMKEFLDQNYLTLFKIYLGKRDKIFIVNGKKINISEKTKIFIDLIQKNKVYKEKLFFVAKYYFLNEDEKQNV